MSSSNCLNCEVTLDFQARYCPNCGQKTNTHRLTLSHILHDFFHALTHADKGILYLLRALALKPGIAAEEYIAGKRVKYFNPFSLFLILMGIYVISNNFFAPPPKPRLPDSAVLARIPTEEGKKTYVTMMRRSSEVTVFMNKHGNILAMFAVPLFTFLSWMVYRKAAYNFAEHLTANLLFVTFSNLVFTVLIFPLQGMFGTGRGVANMFIFLGQLLQVVYITWCYYQFLPSRPGFLKLLGAFGLSLLGVILWNLVTLTAVAIYMYRSPAFINFFTRMFS
ncbi:DUF3667 domain-containing protein [Flavitalea sp.]|nr:DUF3667 domain-containing protein [Flavitalea sp.]